MSLAVSSNGGERERRKKKEEGDEARVWEVFGWLGQFKIERILVGIGPFEIQNKFSKMSKIPIDTHGFYNYRLFQVKKSKRDILIKM